VQQFRFNLQESSSNMAGEDKEDAMLLAVLFEDDPAAGPEIRRRHMPAHLAFLERHGAQIRAAGPLQDSDGGAAGGLWLVEADDHAAVEALVKADPFWAAGLRRTVRLLGWNRVFADGRRLTEADAGG